MVAMPSVAGVGGHRGPRLLSLRLVDTGAHAFCRWGWRTRGPRLPSLGLADTGATLSIAGAGRHGGHAFWGWRTRGPRLPLLGLVDTGAMPSSAGAGRGEHGNVIEP